MNQELLPNAVYTTKEAMKLLHIGEMSLLKNVHSGKIKASMAGNKFVYLGKDLLQYLENTKISD